MSITKEECAVEIITLTDSERAAILPHSQQAMIGGRSDIFDDRMQRQAKLAENQMIGLGCEAAFFKWAEPFGSGGFDAWLEQRCLRNQNKREGDGGWDCVLRNGIKVDIKGSECRRELTQQSALSYHLTQARSSTLLDVVYVQCHTQRHMDSYQIPSIVMLAGWLLGSELSGREDMPQMKGWSARCSSIHRMSDLKKMLIQ